MKAKAVTGSAGVHFVAYRLSTMGYIVALTREGIPAIDLMVYSPGSGKTVSIQVKTASDASPSGKKERKKELLNWRVSKKALELKGKGVFYAFVDMRGCATDQPKPKETPDVFIVPAEWVANPEHRNISYSETALGSLNNYPKDKPPTDFWFDLYPKGKKKWSENWGLITNILGPAHEAIDEHG